MTTTLVGLLHDGMKAFNDKVENSDFSSGSQEYQQCVDNLIQHFTKLRHYATVRGVLSRNEELDDVMTDAILFYLIPYYLAELHVKKMPSASDTEDAEAVGGSRERVLAVAMELYKDFLSDVVSVGIVKESEAVVDDDVGAGKPVDRAAKVALAKRVKELQEKQRSLESRRKNRISTLEKKGCESHDVDEDPEVEEITRELNLATVRVTVGKVVSSYPYVVQELNMLRSLTKEQREQAVREYRQAIEEMKRGPPPDAVPVTRIGAVDRMEIKDTAFINRNAPTQTLAEFADEEIAYMKEAQARADAKGARDKAEWDSLTQDEQEDAKQ
eukprot:PhF_6_TR2196/c0_g1_i3/m.3643/K17606/IGBP1, TAP42; immunoglobulin-binding protein 1